jgi:hypothetical protein
MDAQNQPTEQAMFVDLPLPTPVHHRHLLEFDGKKDIFQYS